MLATNENPGAGDAGAQKYFADDSDTNSQNTSERQIDLRLAFLARAAARLDMYDIGMMSLDEAYGGLFEDWGNA